MIVLVIKIENIGVGVYFGRCLGEDGEFSYGLIGFKDFVKFRWRCFYVYFVLGIEEYLGWAMEDGGRDAGIINVLRKLKLWERMRRYRYKVDWGKRGLGIGFIFGNVSIEGVSLRVYIRDNRGIVRRKKKFFGEERLKSEGKNEF